jgi:tryptophan-rich sensory protein
MATWQTWYENLNKPSWTPSPNIIGMIWTTLYPIIFVTYGYVFWKCLKKEIPWMVAIPFIINITANIVFTPIQFGLRNLPLSSIDIFIVLITIIWTIIVIYPYSKLIAFAQIPYLIWVSLATILQISITLKN